MRAAIIVFPGSNCDRDMQVAIKQTTGSDPIMVWHADHQLPKNLDFIAIPGGFSYGDYLRCGAMSAHSPIMREIKKAAEKGVYILGICNGFQILTETGLLPGTLMRNRDLRFICKDVHLEVFHNESAFTQHYTSKQIIRIPVAHHDGNFFANPDVIAQLEQHSQIAFRYCDAHGEVNDNANPNGSQGNIAGIYDKNKRILGMMPHPERQVDPATGGEDGIALFNSLISSFN